MVNSIIHNILSSNEIIEILDNEDVIINKEKLSNTDKVSFSIQVSAGIKTKLENSFGIDLSQLSSIPMRWVRGDTPIHIDKGTDLFNNTYLVYLTDSIGNLVVDGNSYPINAGNGHIFSEGLQHYTSNNGNTERLLIGPISENGFQVGLAPLVSFTMNTFSDYYSGEGFMYTWLYNSPNDPQITIFDLPPPTPETTTDYNIYNYDSSVNWTPPPGKIFGGWKLMERDGNAPIEQNHELSRIYMPGETYTLTGYTWLVPNWIDPPIVPICFTANTPINTDQGIIPIEKINPKINTIGNKKIVAITKTISPDDYLVCFEKNSIANNIPSQKTIVSKDHLIYNERRMIKASEFVAKYKNVYKIKYTGEILYNVLMENYDRILVNNLICETLHPHSVIAQLYANFSHYNLEKQCILIKKYNRANTSHKKRLIYTNR